MKIYFSNIKEGKGKIVQEGLGCTDSKAWELEQGLESGFLKVDLY